MRGRKPQPAALKLLRGTFRTTRDNANEPKAPGKLSTKAPEEIAADAVAAGLWTTLVKQLARAGIVKPLDKVLLTTYCKRYSQWRAAMIQVDTLGTIVKSPSGYPIPNPYLAVMTRAANDMAKFGAELGLSPTARARIRVDAPREAEQELEDLLAPPKTKGGKHA